MAGGRPKLTDADKLQKINDYLIGKEQSVIDEFESKDTLEKKYKYYLSLTRTPRVKEKESSVEESSVDTIISSLTSVLRKKLSTDDLTKLKDSLNNAITTIDTKIDANKKSDDIIKLKEAIKAMEEAKLDTTSAKEKLAELMK